MAQQKGKGSAVKGTPKPGANVAKGPAKAGGLKPAPAPKKAK